MTTRRPVVNLGAALLGAAALTCLATRPELFGNATPGWNATLAAQAAQAKRPMSLLDVVALPRIVDPQLSPDGQSVTYTLSRMDWDRNGQVQHVWKRSVTGGPPTQLTAGDGEFGARWSPDGKSLLYMSGGQIFVLPAAGGASRPLTKHAGIRASFVTPITMPAWSPDGAAIYFVAADPRPASTTGADQLRVFGQTDVTQQHLWKVSVATGVEERITSGDWSVLAYRLSRDGKRLVVLRPPTAQAIDHYRSEVWVMDADGRNGRALTENNLYEIDAELSPDNSRVLFLVDANEKMEPYFGQSLFVVNATGGAPRMLLPNLGHSIDSATWSPDGSAIFAVVNLGVHQEIYRVDLQTGAARALTNGNHAIPQILTLVPAAKRLIFQFDEPTRLADAWTLPLDGGDPTRVTGVYDSWATDFALPRQEKVSWRGADGAAIEGVLFYPIGYESGRRYPLVVQLHGGPADSDKFGWGPNFIFNYVPVLTGHGYAVLRPNYRGSSGYGSAFMRDIIGHYFNNMQLDVLAGVDAMVRQGIADPDRLALSGSSAGAHLVNKLITVTGRFKAASSNAGVANWISLLGQTDAVTRRTFWIGGTPWQKDAPFDVLWNNSPIKDVWKVTTPTLFVAGELDPRVPLAQSQEMYRGLEANNVATRLIIGAGEQHQWAMPRNLFAKANDELAWFERYVTKRPYQPELAPARSSLAPNQPSR